MAGQANVVFILTLLIVSVSSQISTLYDVTNPSPFYESNLTSTDPNCPSLMSCFGNTSKLTDGDFGPMDSLNGQLGRFFAFNQNDSRLTFTAFSPISTVVLYFFNSPADGIGLPQLKVAIVAGNDVPYFFSNNDELTLTDSQLRTVTLQFNQTVTTFQIDFTFPVNSRINWFLVSEVQFFNGSPVSAPVEDIVFKDGSISVVTLGPDNIQSSISINCTVLNNGSFHWNWLFNNTIPITDELFIEDATRTSILYINGLSYSNEGNYTCTANSTAGSMASKIIQIIISSSTSSTSTISSSSASIATATGTTNSPAFTTTSITVAFIPSSTITQTTPAVANGGLDTVVVGLSVSLGIVAFIIVGLILLTIVLVKCRKRCANRSLQVPMYKISYNITANNKSSFRSEGNDETDFIPENDIPLFQRNTLTDVLYDIPDIPEETNPPADDDDVIYAKPKVNKVMRIKNESFEEIALLGTGQFGEVVLAKTIGLSLKDLRLDKTDDDKFATVRVAVKKIRENQSDESIIALKKEIKFMSQLDHNNVVRLLAVSAESCQEQFIVMEYMENGDLNKFLMDHSFTDSHPPEENELSPNILLSFCIQVANGMSYLSSRNFIHRDLASRNILVGPDYIVKVGDFGLSRNLYDSSYYKVSGKAKMPIRWMAKECFYGKFSEVTDLWAFGVTVWEIYMMSRDYPYSFMTDQEVIDNALKGFNCVLLEKPETCPERVFSVIVKLCWSKERKTFAQVHKELVHADQRLYQYCDVLHWN